MTLEHRIQELGNELIADSRAVSQEPNWLDALISQAIADPELRIQSLRFIDTLPSLNDDISLTRHLQAYFSHVESHLPELAKWGLNQTDKPWLAHIAAPLVRYTVRGLSRRFMGGSNIQRAVQTLNNLRNEGMNSSLDILGEACVSEKEADIYQQAYLDMIPAMSAHMKKWDDSTTLDHQHGRRSPRLNVSIKLSSLYSQIDTADIKGSVKAIRKRLFPVLECAQEHQAFVLIDMEQYDLKPVILECFLSILNDNTFNHWPDFGIAIQAYLKQSCDDLSRIVLRLKKRATPATVRLVRGAYWDQETIIARQNNWSSPLWSHKNDTDANFELCLEYLLSSHQYVDTAVATHNTRSLAVALALAEQHQLSSQDFEFQMLYGMADALKKILVQKKQSLRVYVPYGETLPGMAYLVRRLLENSSGQSLMDIGLANGMGNGMGNEQPIKLEKPEFSAAKAVKHKTDDNHFKNQAVLRFTDQSEIDSFTRALEKCRQEFGKDYPLIINGKAYNTAETIRSFNPACTEETIGIVASANQQLADAAVNSAKIAQLNWRQLDVRERADYLRSIAACLQQRRLEFSAWQVFEAGKNWRESDADVCEAIDFLYYYAAQAERLEQGMSHILAGEENKLRYRPRGVGLVIPPWNFPLAILTGMLSATIVSGNTALLKPSSQTPVIAAKFVELMHQAGLPDGVVNLLSGCGSEIGDYLAKHPDIQLIAFTGSMKVGMGLINIAAQQHPDQQHIKRIIAEMGGKNAIIIDEDADMDVAVTGTVNSAFGFQGQKCSAASRVIVLDHIYDSFLERLIEATRSLTIGPPQQAGYFMGPVINQQAYDKINTAIHEGKQHATMALNNSLNIKAITALEQGYYIPPVIFTDVDPHSQLAQHEIFGPVLSVLRASDFPHAIKLANDTKYALTGGVYSRDPANLELAKNEFNVGNLYLNRKITGALVSRQPFGGHKMSGIGYKAGSENYLLQFYDSSTITENTMRRGFAPAQKPEGE